MTRTLRSQLDRVARLATRTAAAAGLVVGSASVAHAQWWPTGSNNGSYGNAPQNATLLFEWQGRVDREAEFDIGNRGVDVRGINGEQVRGRLRQRSDLPRGNGQLIVQRLDGRGAVDVVQQPASSNRGNGRYGNGGYGNGGYGNGGNGNQFGVVRIRDTQGGVGNYTIRVYWQSFDNTNGNGNGQYDRNDRRRGDDRRGDDRYDDRRGRRGDNGSDDRYDDRRRRP